MKNREINLIFSHSVSKIDLSYLNNEILLIRAVGFKEMEKWENIVKIDKKNEHLSRTNYPKGKEIKKQLKSIIYEKDKYFLLVYKDFNLVFKLIFPDGSINDLQYSPVPSKHDLLIYDVFFIKIKQ